MLLSMTGHGEAHRHGDGLSIAVEIRTVNNRYFKLNLRMTEGYAPLESHIESLLRQQIRRGTAQLSLQIDRASRPEDYRAIALRALTLHELHRADEAREADQQAVSLINKYLELNPNEARAYSLGSNALARLGERDHSRQWSEQAIALAPNDL